MIEINELKEKYKLVIKQLEKGDYKDSVKLPKYASIFQFSLFDRLSLLSELNEEKSRLIYDTTFNTKIGTTDISSISPSATESKTLVSTSKEIRKINRKIDDTEAELKLLEDMITTIKNHSYNLSIYGKGKELYE